MLQWYMGPPPGNIEGRGGTCLVGLAWMAWLGLVLDFGKVGLPTLMKDKMNLSGACFFCLFCFLNSGCAFPLNSDASANQSKVVVHLYNNGSAELSEAFDAVYNHFEKTYSHLFIVWVYGIIPA